MTKGVFGKDKHICRLNTYYSTYLLDQQNNERSMNHDFKNYFVLCCACIDSFL